MDIIWFGHQAWDRTWTSKQQLMWRLAGRGHLVLYIDPVAESGRCAPRERAPNLWTIAGETCSRDPVGTRAARFIRPVRGARLLGMRKPVVVISRPQSTWLHRPLRPQQLVYYACDEWTAFHGLSEERRRRYRQQENALLRQADLALAVSPRLVRRFASLCANAQLLPNAADDSFAREALAEAAPHPQMSRISGPRLLYLGQVDDRVDVPLLAAIARARHHWHIILAGRTTSGCDLSPLADLPNVHCLDFQPREALPSLVREADAGLAPYRVSALTQACCPLKAYEYARSGIPVVTTPVEGLLLDDAIARRATGVEAWIAQIEAALAEQPDDRARRAIAMAQERWERRVDDLEQWLDGSASNSGRQLDAKDAAEEQLRNPRPGEARRYTLQRMAVRAASAVGPVRTGQRILVVRLGVLGDLIACLPMLRALRQGHPNAYIALGAGSPALAEALFTEPGLVDEIVDLRPLRARGRLARLTAECRLARHRFDTIIGTEFYAQLPNALRCGPRRRIAFDDGHPVSSLSNELVRIDPHLHEADNCLHLAEAAGGYATEAQRIPTLTAKAVLPGLLSLSGKPVVVVHVGASRPSRRWGTDRFAQLIAQLIEERPVQVALTGVAEEAALGQALMEQLPSAVRERVAPLAGRTTLTELKQLLAGAAACVCNDTGVMHLARAIGTPLLALLGPENDRRWGPHPMGPGRCIAIRHATPCGPCNRYRCGEHHCMARLTVDEALTATNALLDHPQANAIAVEGMDQPVHRVEERIHNESWVQLHTGGQPVPAVTIAVFADATTRPPELRRTVTSLLRQRYPLFRLALIDTRSRPEPLGLPVEQRWIFRSNNPHSAWGELNRQCSGDWVVGLRPGCQPDEEMLGRQVAALMRSPDAASVDAQGCARSQEAEQNRGAPWFDGCMRRSSAHAQSAPAAVVNSSPTPSTVSVP